MNTVKLSNNGIIIIPELLLQTYSWKEGQEFVLEETQQGLLLKPKSYFPPTTIEEVAGCLAYRGEPKSQSDYEEAIQKGITEEWNGIG
ncbi:MAG: AbrB/MazE/SpoVT family DNA-binding domain-containing protein [Leptospiraceae bacterium]|nr:AbrB/MazE/SpoVT family DNA-binding domain-containing protein [Leptospiraceae bacterium]MCP5493199.1 AbrB/MazE/SpoVT family DNA-binding domain-containing protein [Leptospiraceae bacterium]